MLEWSILNVIFIIFYSFFMLLFWFILRYLFVFFGINLFYLLSDGILFKEGLFVKCKFLLSIFFLIGILIKIVVFSWEGFLLKRGLFKGNVVGRGWIDEEFVEIYWWIVLKWIMGLLSKKLN